MAAGASSSASAGIVNGNYTVGFDIKASFEDDLRNIEMFKSEGVPCVYIHSGYYDA